MLKHYRISIALKSLSALPGLFISFCWLTTPTAQAQTYSVQTNPFPSLTFANRQVFFDADADGDVDLLYQDGSTAGTGIALRLNNGSGNFSTLHTATNSGGTGTFSSGPLNGIGFTQISPSSPFITPVDYDNDGDTDLYESVDNGAGRLIRNNGNATFTVQTNPFPLLTFANRQVFFDADADGDIDLLYQDGNTAGGGIVLRLNNGSGNFSTLHTATNSGGTGTFSSGPLNGIGFTQISFTSPFITPVDYDNDGDTDLYEGINNGTGRLIRNNGNATFTVSTNPFPSLAFANRRVFFDADKDGDVDLLYQESNTAGTGIALRLNNGSGNFSTLHTATNSGGTGTFSSGPLNGIGFTQISFTSPLITPIDYDNDGDTDLYESVSAGAGRVIRQDQPCVSLYTVTTTADAGAGSLRQAMTDIAAMTCPSPFTINITATGTINTATVLPTITKDMTITGPGASQLTISGQDNTHQLFIADGTSGINLKIAQVTIIKGGTGGGGAGGAIEFNSGTGSLTVSSCALLDNGGVGQIYANGTNDIVLENSTISNNPSGGGNGLVKTTGLLSIVNSTISGNTSALYTLGVSTINLLNVTLANNSICLTAQSQPATVTLKNTILTDQGITFRALGGGSFTITSQGYNSCSNAELTPFATTGDLSNTNPLLAPLGNYGGPTPTFALLPGSPAINAGTASGAPTTDQRGIGRVGTTDIGSFESRGFSMSLTSGNNQSATVGTALANPLRVTVSSANSEPVNGGVVTYTGPGSGADISPTPVSATIASGVAGASVAANATTGGPYTVAATARGVSPTVNFSLTNTPTAPTIAGFAANPSTVCVGSPITFTATVGNVSPPYAFTLSNGTSSTMGNAGSTAFSQNLTAAGSGSQSFTLTVNDGGSSARATTNVTVSALSPDYQPLVDFYNATNGPNWTDNAGWLSGCDPCTGNSGFPWSGVFCSNGRVRALRIADNQLSGSIPASLGGLTNIISIELDANALTGNIPSELSALTNLQLLNLAGNQLSGSIPASFSALTNLEVLDLFSNQLTGSIPPSLSAATSLRTIRISENRLSGSIPTSFSALSNLRELLLRSNQLTGGIPASIGSLTALTTLEVGFNPLGGPIPPGLGALPLTRLDARDAQLTGCFPASLSALCGGDIAFGGNPGLPGGGDFGAFCATRAGSDAFVARASASPSVACVGSVVSLSASGGTSYTWTAPAGAILSSATGAVISTTLTMAGVQTFTTVVSNGGSCTATATTSVTANALPVAGLVNNGPLTCTQTSVTLTASGGTSYTFTAPGGTVLAGSGNTRSVTTAGTYSVTVGNANGCVSTTSTTVISNTATVSVTNPTVTTATVGTPFNRVFSVSGVASLSLASGSLPTGVTLSSAGVLSGTPMQTGSFTFTVRATDANGCVGVSAPYTLTVNAATPTLTGFAANPSTVCVGSPITFTATVGNVSPPYAFTLSNGTSSTMGNAGSTAFSQNLTASGTGNQSFTLTVGDNGFTATATTSVSVTTPPSATIAYPGSPFSTTSLAVDVTQSGTPGGTYSSSPAGLSLNTGTGRLTPVSSTPGDYTVTYTLASRGGCPSFTTTAPVSISSPPAQADLAITLTDGVTSVVPGGSVTYTITASNAGGPSNAPGALVSDVFPASLTNVTWTAIGAGGGTVAASGSGNINELVNLPVGGSVTFTVSATVSSSAQGLLTNTATVTSPAGVTDPNPANDSASDTDMIIPATPTITGFSVSPNPVCVGNGVTFTATVGNVTGSYSYTLSNGNNTTTGSSSNMTFSQTLTAAGSGIQSFTLTVNGNNGQVVTAATSLTVNALPVAGLTNNGPLTCAQTSVTLTASGGTSYSFSAGANQIGSSNLATVNASGTYSVTVGNANGCVSTTSTTVISNTAVPAATLTASSMAVCSPAAITLTAGGGLSYTFSAGAIQVGTTNQAIVTQGGTYSVTVSNASGCTAMASLSVTVNTPPPAPMLTGVSRTVTASNTPLPLGQFVTATGGNTLSFSGVNGTLTPPNADISQSGIKNFSVSQTDGNGCASPSTPFSITVVAVSPVSQTVCRSSEVVLSAGLPGSRYEWYKNGQSAPFKLTEIASIQKGTATSSLTLISVQTTASYYCKIFQSNGSFAFVGPFSVVVNYGCIAPGARLAASEESVAPLVVQLVPNPLLNGQVRAIVTGVAGVYLKARLTDLNGQVIRSQDWPMAEASQRIDWDISGKPISTYLLQVQAGNQVRVVKVVKGD